MSPYRRGMPLGGGIELARPFSNILCYFPLLFWGPKMSKYDFFKWNLEWPSDVQIMYTKLSQGQFICVLSISKLRMTISHEELAKIDIYGQNSSNPGHCRVSCTKSVHKTPKYRFRLQKGVKNKIWKLKNILWPKVVYRNILYFCEKPHSFGYFCHFRFFSKDLCIKW